MSKQTSALPVVESNFIQSSIVKKEQSNLEHYLIMKGIWISGKAE